MSDGYETPHPDGSGRSELDEFLAEYVDGTMDPVVREAFEELLRVDPEIADRVFCLKHLRTELCQLNCQCAAPDGFEQRLRQQLDREIMDEHAPVLPDMTTHLGVVAALASMILLLIVGGATYEAAFHPVPATAALTTQTAEPLEGRSDAQAEAELPERFFLARDEQDKIRRTYARRPIVPRRTYRTPIPSPSRERINPFLLIQASTGTTTPSAFSFTPGVQHAMARQP